MAEAPLPEVSMLDLTDRTMHLPGSVHQVTRCGLTLGQCQVGPTAALLGAAFERFCTSCWPMIGSGGSGG